ncbi:MAG: hypothetical protein ACRYGP_15620 [Janthinobacterium lividum]
MVTEVPSRLRRREIRDDDLVGVVDMLVRGFPARSRGYWEKGLGRMKAMPKPDGCPRYGFLLDDGQRPVGVSLMLFATDLDGHIRCNLSSWTVDPAFRMQAPLLIASALKQRHVTFTNISPAPHTWATIEAQGFEVYSEGKSLVFPSLSRSEEPARILADPAVWRDLPEAKLLDDHAGFGCSSLAIVSGGELYPLVLAPARARGGRWPLPLMQIVYCRDMADLSRFAGAIGRWMMLRGFVGLILDGEPSAGLRGLHRVRRARRYVKGPHPPRVGDLSYTERVIFGP